jgi:dTDP-4-amino-4,6-dideoxygalactose transaminase
VIPRFKPYLDTRELSAALRLQKDAVEHFEAAFARTFETRHGIAFRYGRSALWAFFRALHIENAEVIMPAFTCRVVGHAVVLSGNIPRFVDITMRDYNMDLEQVAAAITHQTRAIIATHLFGYPVNTVELDDILGSAEARWGHKIWVIQDCAQAIGSRWQGRLVCKARDTALFSLHVSKTLTCIAGGIITTDDAEVHRKLRAFRNEQFAAPSSGLRLRTYYHLVKSYPRYSEPVYYWVDWLKENTGLPGILRRGRRSLEGIGFPQDHLSQMLDVEAGIGLSQLQKYPDIVRAQRDNARYYAERLQAVPRITLPPLVDGATYSQYVVRMPHRQAVLVSARRHGVHLAPWIDYSLPTTAAFKRYSQNQAFPNAQVCSETCVSLPTYAALTVTQRARVVEALLCAL